VVFRCNLVAVRDGRMWDYSSGHISTGEAQKIIETINQRLGSDKIHFYPGVSYRHLCKLKDSEDTILAVCTPPHDIPNKLVEDHLPRGTGSELLRELMANSVAILKEHPVNAERRSQGDIPATMIWLFWGSGQIPEMPDFKQTYGLNAVMSSGVDLLYGLAQMIDMKTLNIPGVTDGLDNDYAAQGIGALNALAENDLVVIHVEAPDEAAHSGLVEEKIEAIQCVDREIISRIRNWQPGNLRVLIMPDHPTPIEIQTHSSEPVPFMLWGPGFAANGAQKFTEFEAKNTGFFINEGYKIMGKLIQ
ncbi:MAG: cofactor-independent phosphoglycerate mutase, partial [Dehalococcoidales bacterium]|nr:cofactor-independent phosphoglycerate mutase [Dehalococcoidales bacterium]